MARPPVPGQVLPGAARATGQAHVLYMVLQPGAATAAPVLMSLHTITGAWAAQDDAGVGAANDETAGGAVATVVPWKNGLLWSQAVAISPTTGAATALRTAQIESP